MARGFGVRLLLLSLLAFGQPAEAFSYSSRETIHLRPSVQQHEAFPRSTKAASAFAPTEGFPGPTYYPGSPQNLEPAADAPWTGAFRSSYGGGADPTFVERYASSVRKTPLQQHFQTVSGGHGAPLRFMSGQKKRYALGIVSSPAIVMHFVPSESKTEHQGPNHMVQQQHQSRPIFHPDQLRQISQQVWPQRPDRAQTQHLSHPVFGPVRPQRRSDIWRFRVPPTETRSESGVPSGFEHEPDSHGRSEAQLQQPRPLSHVQPAGLNPRVAEAGRPRSFGKVLVYGPGW